MNQYRYYFRFVLAVCVSSLVSCFEPAAYAECIYSAGHGDVRISYEDDSLSLGIRVDAVTTLECDTPLPPGTTLLDPSETVIFVSESAAEIRSELPAWDIVGVSAGETFYQLPQSGLSAQINGLPFLGLSTLDVPSGVFVGNQVMLALTDVISAPEDGQFALYTGQTVPFREFDTQDGSFDNDVITLPAGIHDHRNWSFSKPGRYELEFTAFGNLVGAPETAGPDSVSAVLTFQVTPVPEPSTAILALIGGSLFVLLGVRRGPIRHRFKR